MAMSLNVGTQFDSDHFIAMTASICGWVALCFSYSCASRMWELLHCTQSQEGGCGESTGAQSQDTIPSLSWLLNHILHFCVLGGTLHWSCRSRGWVIHISCDCDFVYHPAKIKIWILGRMTKNCCMLLLKEHRLSTLIVSSNFCNLSHSSLRSRSGFLKVPSIAMTGWDSISAAEVTLLVTSQVLEQDFLSMFSTSRMC